MNREELSELQQMARRVREHVIRMSVAGGCFIGAALSCTDLLVYLYRRFLIIESGRRGVDDPDRDIVLLSKGHAVPALYATLAEVGILDPARLAHHLSIDDDIYWHPNRRVPGVEFHSGSLGHGLPVGAGVALEARLRGSTRRVIVVTGDGELDEGSNWEALLIAAARGLDNLVVVVDRNVLQANLPTEDLVPLEPLAAKFAAFGCGVTRLDGHDFVALEDAFSRLPLETGRPSVVIADTVRGRGLPSIEGRVDRWFYQFSEAEAGALLAELATTADLASSWVPGT